jgi:D-alanyl-D-alanine carboxypeptidase
METVIKKLLPAALACIFLLPRIAPGEDAPPQVGAQSAVVIDIATGTVLYEKNADKRQYPASITKIMTGFLGIARGGDLDQMITVSRKAAYDITPGSSSISMKPGETAPLKDILYGLMLQSANECGNVVAEHVSGSNEAFAALMNKTAEDWGLKNTRFMNPHGLHNKDHVTTARDMAVIARHALESPAFREIVKTPVTFFPDTNKHKSRERGELTNKNYMLHRRNNEYYEPCIGIKGGYTTHSLHTFVAAAEKDGHGVIACVLREPDKALMYRDLVALMEYGFRQFENRTLASRGEVLLTKEFPRGSAPLKIAAGETLEKNLPRQCAAIEKDFRLKDLALPVREGDAVGEAVLTAGGLELGRLPLVAANTVVSSLSWHNLSRFVFSVPVLLAGGILMALFFFMLGRRHERKYR